MSKPAILLFVVFLIGCEAKVQMHVDSKPSEQAVAVAVVKPKPEPTDAEKIALLRAEAHKRGLVWNIHCFDWEESSKAFSGFAHERKVPDGARFIEDGATPWYYSQGPTQADVAYALYLQIQAGPNVPVTNRDSEVHHKKICPPELRGQ